MGAYENSYPMKVKFSRSFRARITLRGKTTPKTLSLCVVTTNLPRREPDVEQNYLSNMMKGRIMNNIMLSFIPGLSWRKVGRKTN